MILALQTVNSNLLSVPRVRTTFAYRGFSVTVAAMQPPLCGTRSHLASTTLPLPIPSVAFLKPTASSRLSAPLSGSPMSQIRPLADTVHSKHLLTYLLTM